MSDRQFIIGIDLGTTNSVLAYCRAGAEEAEIELLPIPQLTAAATVRKSGPRCRRFSIWLVRVRNLRFDCHGPMEQRTRLGIGPVTWQVNSQNGLSGRPNRGWPHSRVDRHSQILPFGSSDELPKISPVDARQAITLSIWLRHGTKRCPTRRLPINRSY